METRVFYKHAMKAGSVFHVLLPKNIVNALEIKDRDELEISIKKTGNKVEKKKNFSKEPKVVSEE